MSGESPNALFRQVTPRHDQARTLCLFFSWLLRIWRNLENAGVCRSGTSTSLGRSQDSPRASSDPRDPVMLTREPPRSEPNVGLQALGESFFMVYRRHHGLLQGMPGPLVGPPPNSKACLSCFPVALVRTFQEHTP